MFSGVYFLFNVRQLAFLLGGRRPLPLPFYGSTPLVLCGAGLLTPPLSGAYTIRGMGCPPPALPALLYFSKYFSFLNGLPFPCRVMDEGGKHCCTTEGGNEYEKGTDWHIGCSAAAVFSPAGGILPVQRIPVFPRKNIDSVFTVDCLDLR